MVEASGVIGKGLRVRGDVTGRGALSVAGEVQGTIRVDHLTVEAGGVVSAEISAEDVTIHGRSSGNIEATDRVRITASAVVDGEVRAPSIVIEDGAQFRGSVHMDVDLPEER